MNILYIAYSCSPNHGSEDRIGWKIPLISAKTNRVFVITKEEHRKEIEEYQDKSSESGIQFFYIDIPSFYKRFLKGTFYAGRLNLWQSRALERAKELCRREKIDLIHQITPVEFRSIGDYGSIADVKYVCGPVGGGEFIPDGLETYGRGHLLEESIRRAANRMSLYHLKKKQILRKCDALLYVNEETKDYLSNLEKGGEVTACMAEIGIDRSEIRKRENPPNKKCIFLTAGRLVYRKGHELFLDVLSEIPEQYDFEWHIVGSGPELEGLKAKAGKFPYKERIHFHGRVSFNEMDRIYQNSDVLVMPSIRETTGSVLLEAMARELPVITIGRFGASTLLREKGGWLYDGNSKTEIMESLKMNVLSCLSSLEERQKRAKKALELAENNIWEKKMETYQTIYEQLQNPAKTSNQEQLQNPAKASNQEQLQNPAKASNQHLTRLRTAETANEQEPMIPIKQRKEKNLIQYE